MLKTVWNKLHEILDKIELVELLTIIIVWWTLACVYVHGPVILLYLGAWAIILGCFFGAINYSERKHLQK